MKTELCSRREAVLKKPLRKKHVRHRTWAKTSTVDHFDTSNFASERAQYSAQNKRALSKFKSDMGSSPPKEFVGLRVKMYRMHVPSATSKSQQKVKGVEQHFVKNTYDTSSSSTYCDALPSTLQANFDVFAPRSMSSTRWK